MKALCVKKVQRKSSIPPYEKHVCSYAVLYLDYVVCFFCIYFSVFYRNKYWKKSSLLQIDEKGYIIPEGNDAHCNRHVSDTHYPSSFSGCLQLSDKDGVSETCLLQHVSFPSGII